MTATCFSCGEVRPLADLLLVTRLRDGATRYVHRPSLTPQSCFSRLASAVVESIEPADPDAWQRAVAAHQWPRR